MKRNSLGFYTSDRTFAVYLLCFYYTFINILNLPTAAVSAFVASLVEHRLFWHEVSTERLTCAGKTVSFVVRNDFSTPHRRVLKLHKQ